MKNTILIALLSIFTLFVTSCTKPEDNPRPDNSIVNIEDGATLTGVTWRLSDAKFYTENMDNQEKKYYDHFGVSSVSTLDPISGNNNKVDTIINGVTTWDITNTTFVLNGTTSYNITGNTTTAFSIITPPTARPVEILELTTTKLVVKIHEGFGSDGVFNYNYFSVLTFNNQANPCNCPSIFYSNSYVYGGVVSNTPTSSPSLNGTKWVVTRYDESMTPYYPNDTLLFSTSTYTINSGTPRTYNVVGSFFNNMKELTLNSCTTLGGSYGGFVVSTFVGDYQINATNFTDIFNTNNNKTVWMTRIQ